MSALPRPLPHRDDGRQPVQAVRPHPQAHGADIRRARPLDLCSVPLASALKLHCCVSRVMVLCLVAPQRRLELASAAQAATAAVRGGAARPQDDDDDNNEPASALPPAAGPA